MSREAPTDPQLLRAEIVRVRTDLGHTVEALAAKMDVKARARESVGDFTDQAKDHIRSVRDRVRSGTGSARRSFADSAVSDVVRQPLPMAAFATSAAIFGLVIYLWRRRS